MAGLQATLKRAVLVLVDFRPIYREDRQITAHELLVHESGDILDAENRLLEAHPAVWNEDIGQE